MYVIHATVDAMKLKAEWGTMQGVVDIPEFFVKAETRDDALVEAKLIVDPLRMTDTHITTEEAPRAPYRHNLETALDDAVKALKSEGENDAENDMEEELFALAETVALYLGRNWDQLYYDRGHEGELPQNFGDHDPEDE